MTIECAFITFGEADKANIVFKQHLLSHSHCPQAPKLFIPKKNQTQIEKVQAHPEHSQNSCYFQTADAKMPHSLVAWYEGCNHHVVHVFTVCPTHRDTACCNSSCFEELRPGLCPQCSIDPKLFKNWHGQIDKLVKKTEDLALKEK
jgi:hypothetical protein